MTSEWKILHGTLLSECPLEIRIAEGNNSLYALKHFKIAPFSHAIATILRLYQTVTLAVKLNQATELNCWSMFQPAKEQDDSRIIENWPRLSEEKLSRLPFMLRGKGRDEWWSNCKNALKSTNDSIMARGKPWRSLAVNRIVWRDCGVSQVSIYSGILNWIRFTWMDVLSTPGNRIRTRCRWISNPEF